MVPLQFSVNIQIVPVSESCIDTASFILPQINGNTFSMLQLSDQNLILTRQKENVGIRQAANFPDLILRDLKFYRHAFNFLI